MPNWEIPKNLQKQQQLQPPTETSLFKMATLDEDAVDEILYLARTNEATELASFLAELASQTKRSTADLAAAAVDAYSKNSALHYAAANGHIGIADGKLVISWFRI